MGASPAQNDDSGLDRPSRDPAAAGPGGTVDPAEVARFAAMAEQWWDPKGKFRPLHELNPTRVRYIRDRALAHFGAHFGADFGRTADSGGAETSDLKPLAGLRILDIGCGGGLLCEPLARLGAQVTGIDAADRNIEIARLHAGQAGLAIDYRVQPAEDLVGRESFDVVLAMEVVEHVADPALFLKSCAALVRPGGMMVAATLNRTARAYALAIVGVEYVLRWLPRGTHDWKKFLRPSELARGLRHGGLTVREIVGVSFNPINRSWSLSGDLAVNYMVMAEKVADNPAA
jgi:2-polyprenyl-6-hydroxyphenyl methylase/3-demethylubiquinone-9 3-methyltransferase